MSHALITKFIKWLGDVFIMVLVLLVFASAPLKASTNIEKLPLIKLQSEAKISIGKMLFFDRRLSGDGTMSCAVCHIPDEAFTDDREISGAYPTNKHWRNTPSLLNVAYLNTFFWDGMSDSLKHQAAGPIESPFEMNADLQFISAKLAEIPEYSKAFQEAYGSEVNSDLILDALKAFEQTITVADSPFDQYLAGDTQALTPLARQGMEIFFGTRGGCSECHPAPLLTDQKFYNLGVANTVLLEDDPQHRATRRAVLARHGLPMLQFDPGRYLVSKNPADMRAFRTPLLRQVAQTAPYMHNGSLKNLQEVVAFFSRGGGDDPQKTPQLKVRNFTSEEQSALVAFLESLSGTIPEVYQPLLPGE